jgi:hypothetical protein
MLPGYATRPGEPDADQVDGAEQRVFHFNAHGFNAHCGLRQTKARD